MTFKVGDQLSTYHELALVTLWIRNDWTMGDYSTDRNRTQTQVLVRVLTKCEVGAGAGNREALQSRALVTVTEKHIRVLRLPIERAEQGIVCRHYGLSTHS